MRQDYARISSEMMNAVGLENVPVAICFADAVPEGVTAEPGRAPAGCRFWQDATVARFATSSADHSLCAIGVHTHNLATSPGQQADLMAAIKVFGELGYVRPEDLPLIPVLQSRPRHVIYAPLAETPLPPDVVLVFANALQSLILSEAAEQVEGGHATAMGRPACAVIPQVANTGRAALSLGCCGARAYLSLFNDSTSIFAFPGARIQDYAARMGVLASANAVLSKFHARRRQDVDAGQSPTVEESLQAMA
jgi:uncharacterized protein (DUF169 family)